VSRLLQSVKTRVERVVLPRKLAGDSVQCPICRGTFARFHGRSCPRCGSVERQRLVWLYLEASGIDDRALAILHIAPEPAFKARLQDRPRYVAGDLTPRQRGIQRMDVTALPFPHASFDRAIVNHVLEHVPDDNRAMRELFRVLRPGARLIAHHPVALRRARTYEDPSITTPAERARHFGQHDHVRVYGRDIDERFRAAGFVVRSLEYAAELPPSLVERHGLGRRRRIIHDCLKP
jgi:SAM-dependent methyltransferase